MTIEFGNWRLVEKDARNWELFEYKIIRETHLSKASGTAGEYSWSTTGRFYSYNTFRNALCYAVDVELKRNKPSEVFDITQALELYDKILKDFAQNFPHLNQTKTEVSQQPITIGLEPKTKKRG